MRNCWKCLATAHRPNDFTGLLRILDGELRLITPTDPEGVQTESSIDPGSKFYQLTHDYLVPSLQTWLTRKQQETRKRSSGTETGRTHGFVERQAGKSAPAIFDGMGQHSNFDRKEALD